MYHVGEKIQCFIVRLRHHDSYLKALKTLQVELMKLSLTTNQDSSIYPQKGDHTGNSPYEIASKDLLDHSMAAQAEEDMAEPSHRRLLRILGCPPLHDSNLQSVQDMLDSLASNRSEKAKQGSKNLDAAIDQLLGSHVDTASCTTQLIADGLLEDTPYKNLHLLDERLRVRISKLETEASQTGSGIEELELDKLGMPSKEREDFVNRWDI